MLPIHKLYPNTGIPGVQDSRQAQNQAPHDSDDTSSSGDDTLDIPDLLDGDELESSSSEDDSDSE